MLIQPWRYGGDTAMTILDDLFNLAGEKIQGTADNTQQVIVYAAMAEVRPSDLRDEFGPFPPHVTGLDRLIYIAASVEFQTSLSKFR
jgi:hypothetical protein